MHPVLSTQTNVSVQLGFFDAIKDLLLVDPIFLLGIIIIGVILIVIFRKEKNIPKITTSFFCLIFYYYLSVMLSRIVGIPTLQDYIRLSGLGESFFNPNVNLIPLSDGFSLGFLLNIVLFLPLGFLCPLISKYYRSVKHIFFIGCGLSLFIEIIQLFTQYRATDIDDLITNTIGALLGYLCFRILHRLVPAKFRSANDFTEPHSMRYLPVIIIATAFLFGFFS